MSFRSTPLACAIAAACLLALPQSAGAAETEVLATPAENGVRSGELKNGLRYFIIKDGDAGSDTQLRLVVNYGNFDETAQNVGSAHFIEHMAFNGTQRFAGNRIREIFDNWGLIPGQDWYAFTGDTTRYGFKIPNSNRERLDEGIRILADWAFHQNFSFKEVVDERAVLTSETLQLSDMDPFYALTGTLFASQRYGLLYRQKELENYERIEPAALATLYRRWYVPSNMAVLIRTPLPVKDVLALVEREFGGFPPVAPPSHDYSSLGVEMKKPLVFRRSGAADGKVRISLRFVSKRSAEAHDAAALLQLIVARRVLSIVGRKTSVVVEPELFNPHSGYSAIGIYLVDDQAKEAAIFAEAVSMARMLRDLPIEQAELNWAAKRVEDIFVSPGNSLDHIEANLFKISQVSRSSSINLEALQSWIGSIFDGNGGIAVDIQSSLPGDIESDARNWVRLAASPAPALKLTDAADPGAPVMAIPDLPREGQVAEEVFDKSTGVTTYRLSNGVQLIVRPSSEIGFDSDKVYLSAIAPLGASGARATAQDFDRFNAALHAGGFAEMNRQAVDNYLGAKSARLSLQASDDHFLLSTVTQPADFEDGLKLSILQLQSPALGAIGPAIPYPAEEEESDPVTEEGFLNRVVNSIIGHPNNTVPGPAVEPEQIFSELPGPGGYRFVLTRQAGDKEVALAISYLGALKPVAPKQGAGRVFRKFDLARKDEVIRGVSDAKPRAALIFKGSFVDTAERRAELDSVAAALNVAMVSQFRETLGLSYDVSTSIRFENEGCIARDPGNSGRGNSFVIMTSFATKPADVDIFRKGALDAVATLPAVLETADIAGRIAADKRAALGRKSWEDALIANAACQSGFDPKPFAWRSDLIGSKQLAERLGPLVADLNDSSLSIFLLKPEQTVRLPDKDL